VAAPSDKPADVLQSKRQACRFDGERIALFQNIQRSAVRKGQRAVGSTVPCRRYQCSQSRQGGAKGIVTTKVTLFIDEKGAVAKIAFDDPALAQPFRDSVQSAFAKARFKPGRKGDRAVKARMRIEVMFEPKPANPSDTSASRATAQR
jgi:hypothetical protein